MIQTIDEIEFFLPMAKIPTVTHQEQRITVRRGKPLVYDGPRLKAARQLFLAALRPYAPEEPWDGPIELVVKWLFPMPLSRKVPDGGWKITKPDTDNLIKLLKDCMAERGYFVNDSRVCSEINQKFFAATPGIYCLLRKLDGRGD